jgi:hypothetical protein
MAFCLGAMTENTKSVCIDKPDDFSEIPQIWFLLVRIIPALLARRFRPDWLIPRQRKAAGYLSSGSFFYPPRLFVALLRPPPRCPAPPQQQGSGRAAAALLTSAVVCGVGALRTSLDGDHHHSPLPGQSPLDARLPRWRKAYGRSASRSVWRGKGGCRCRKT